MRTSVCFGDWGSGDSSGGALWPTELGVCAADTPRGVVDDLWCPLAEGVCDHGDREVADLVEEAVMLAVISEASDVFTSSRANSTRREGPQFEL